jgi:PPOX class probable F420-dependent enzyme
VPAPLIDPSSQFGRRVARRLEHDIVAWLTTVGRDGTPQPNPVWFLWEGAGDILTYNFHGAARVAHVPRRPRVALNLNSDSNGNDIVVFRGRAEIVPGAPPAHQNAAYLAKYERAMIRVSGSAAGFASRYSVAIRIHLDGVRGD